MIRSSILFKDQYWIIIRIIIVLFIFCQACQSSVHEDKKDSTNILKRDNRKKPPSSFDDSLLIHSNSAVFFQPDSLQLEKIKSVNEKMVFESLIHDCFFQMRNARLVIQKYWPEIQIVESSKFRYLVFLKANSHQIIDLNTVNDICGIYLFDSLRNPVRINMTNIDSELGFYFQRKKSE